MSDDCLIDLSPIDLLFNDYISSVTETLLHFAIKSCSTKKQQCIFPDVIIRCIIESCLEWRWSYCESQGKRIKYSLNRKLVQVESRGSSRSMIGSAFVDGILIGNKVTKNETFIFDFSYIKGREMDAILGIIDAKFILSDKSSGVANGAHCFNWGLRYDGIVCFHDESGHWKEKMKYEWQDNDRIQMKVEYIHKWDEPQLVISLFIEDGMDFKTSIIASALPGNKLIAEYPLRIAVSMAQGGGFQIIRACKIL